MKVITRKELLELPHALFGEYAGEEFPDNLYIKYDNCGKNDFVSEGFPITSPELPNCESYFRTVEEFNKLPIRTEVHLSELETCRDGTYESMDVRYIVYSVEDIDKMINKLKELKGLMSIGGE